MNKEYNYEEAKIIVKNGFMNNEVLKNNAMNNLRHGGIIGAVMLAISGFDFLATGDPNLLYLATPLTMVSLSSVIPNLAIFCLGRKRAKEGKLDKFSEDFIIKLANKWAVAYPEQVLNQSDIGNLEEDENVKYR